MTTGAGPIDEGYVKYDCDWHEALLPDASSVAELDRWRRLLHTAGLIGHYTEHGVGFGNLSVRAGDAGQFVISGTQTGQLAVTDAAHYCLVTAVDIDGNRVVATGPVPPSSESLTHAALYALDARIMAVVHAHSAALWDQWRDRLPTTSADVPYGTPAMAHEFERLWRDTAFSDQRIAVMAGHDEGLVSVGASLAEAATRMLELAGHGRAPSAPG